MFGPEKLSCRIEVNKVRSMLLKQDFLLIPALSVMEALHLSCNLCRDSGSGHLKSFGSPYFCICRLLEKKWAEVSDIALNEVGGV